MHHRSPLLGAGAVTPSAAMAHSARRACEPAFLTQQSTDRSLNIFPTLYFSWLHTILWYRGIRIEVTDGVPDPLAPPAPSLIPYLLSSILVQRKSAEHSTGEEEGTGAL